MPKKGCLAAESVVSTNAPGKLINRTRFRGWIVGPVRWNLRKLQYLVLAALLCACGSGSSSTSSGSPKTPIVLGSCGNGPASLLGNIFNENPRTASNNPNLSFSANIDPYASQATVSGLDGTCLLQSASYRVIYDSLFPSSLATASGANLAYAPSDPRFQQVNSFFYANRLKSRMDSIGADLSSMGRITIDAHCGVEQNAYFSPSSKLLCMGYTDHGAATVWAADDADVVVHEAGHGVNHALASTATLFSTGEAGAMDEAYADYWARTINQNPRMGEWFLGAIESALHITGIVRDGSQTHLYPDSMVYEVHDDSRTFGEALWKIRQSLGANLTDQLVTSSMRMLPAKARFAEGVQALRDSAVLLGWTVGQRNSLDAVLSAQGLIRTDSAAGLVWPPRGPAQAAFVIDDHTFSAQRNGNCNGVLDQNETALVLFNIDNTSMQQLGAVDLELVSDSAGTSMTPGWNVGEYFRFRANEDFLTALRLPSVMRDDATVAAGFLITANSTGRQNLHIIAKPMNGPAVNIPVYVDVGSAPITSSCSNNSLWP